MILSLGSFVLLIVNWCELLCFFFFQAEDGIRDLVRSRGLGDVYKRQVQVVRYDDRQPHLNQIANLGLCDRCGAAQQGITPVSYTHLTLPTSDLV